MGQVYRAVDVHLDRPVAVKLLSSRLTFDPSFSDRFKREARLAAKLNHPNIATIYAFGEEAGEAYIAMEFVEGMTLEDRLRRGALSYEDIRRYGIQIASALDVAHAMEIIHRDIKPSNLMITRGGDIKVMDFGVARRGGETQLTMDGALVGTANIMAPEIVKGAGATTASDLFSLGCVLFEAIAGRPAFDGENAMAVLYKVMNEDPPDLLTTRDDIPPDVVDLVHGLMIKDPAARFGPAKAVVDRLTAAAPGEPGAGTAVQTETLVLPSAGLAPGPSPGDRSEAATLLPDGTPPPKSPPGPGGTPGPGKPPPALSRPPEIQRLRARNPWPWIGAMAGLVAIGGALTLFLGRGGDARAEALKLHEQALGLYAKGSAAAEPQRTADFAKAKVYLRRAARRDSTWANPLATLGTLLWKEGNTLAALETLGVALRREPNNARAHASLADVYFDRGLKDDAEGEYREALTRSGSDVGLKITSWNNLGYFYIFGIDRPDSARAVLTRATTEFPNEPALWRNLALACEALSADSAAVAAIETAYSLDPNDDKTVAARNRIVGPDN
jgi:serine/threonine-protein kinase